MNKPAKHTYKESRDLAKAKASTEGRTQVYIWQYAKKAELISYVEGTPYELAFPNDEKNKLTLDLKNGDGPMATGMLTPEESTTNDTMHDFAMAKRFLRILTGSNDEAMTFQTFDETTEKDQRLAMWKHLERSTATFDRLKRLQSSGAGVYVMVSRGDGKGRKASNVVAVRALFIDLDYSPWEPAADMLKPHIRVESSPGRFHLYWLVSDCPLDQFKSIQQAIAKKYNGDKSCVDLARVLRLPGFLHQKKEPVLTRLIEVNDFPKYATQQVIDGLHLDMAETIEATSDKRPEPFSEDVQKPNPESEVPHIFEFTDPTTGEIYDLTAWAVQNPTFDIIAALDPQYHRDKATNGKQHIVCPYEGQHTDQVNDLATFIANASPGHPSFTIHCMHSHCIDRDRLDFLRVMLENRWLSVATKMMAITPAFDLRRPLYVTYQTNEILAAPEWTALLPDERRIALDLMTMAWAEIDGMVEDNDWAIARRLGIPQKDWMEYRETLARAGWLKKFNGKLTSPIVKREFDNAQNAYMDSIKFGAMGGRASAEKRKRSTPP